MKPMDFHNWEKIEGGYIKRISGRPVYAIVADIRKNLEKAKLPFEYVSAAGWENKNWPMEKGQNEYAALEVGGNEGYSLFIGTKYITDASMAKPYGTQANIQPIRIKLLCGQDDALKVYEFVLKLMGHFN